MARWLPLAGALLAAGCASSPPPKPAPSSADLGAWVSATEDHASVQSTALARSSLPAAALGPRTIHAAVEAPPRPRRAVRIDVNLQKAEMANAFQLLADVGRFNLVMQDGLTGQLSASMRNVDPYDALVALAQANGLDVKLEGDVVVMTKKK